MDNMDCIFKSGSYIFIWNFAWVTLIYINMHLQAQTMCICEKCAVKWLLTQLPCAKIQHSVDGYSEARLRSLWKYGQCVYHDFVLICPVYSWSLKGITLLVFLWLFWLQVHYRLVSSCVFVTRKHLFNELES